MCLGKSFHFETILIKKRLFVTIDSCAFNIQFERVIRCCRPNFWEFEEIIEILMIVSKDELVALS